MVITLAEAKQAIEKGRLARLDSLPSRNPLNIHAGERWSGDGDRTRDQQLGEANSKEILVRFRVD